jgi:hypothetical protein
VDTLSGGKTLPPWELEGPEVKIDGFKRFMDTLLSYKVQSCIVHSVSTPVPEIRFFAERMENMKPMTPKMLSPLVKKQQPSVMITT